MVELYNSGKPRAELICEYELTPKKNLLNFERNSTLNNGKRYFKAGSVDYRTKINIVIQNADKYQVSGMCKLLYIPRSSLYYNRNKNLKKKKFNDHYLTDLIKKNI